MHRLGCGLYYDGLSGAVASIIGVTPIYTSTKKDSPIGLSFFVAVLD